MYRKGSRLSCRAQCPPAQCDGRTGNGKGSAIGHPGQFPDWRAIRRYGRAGRSECGRGTVGTRKLQARTPVPDIPENRKI